MKGILRCPNCEADSEVASFSVYVDLGAIIDEEREICLLQTSMCDTDEYFSFEDSCVSLDEIGECSECDFKNKVKEFVESKC